MYGKLEGLDRSPLEAVYTTLSQAHEIPIPKLAGFVEGRVHVPFNRLCTFLGCPVHKGLTNQRDNNQWR